MNKKSDKLSQILLWATMICLLLFLGTGIYFVIQGFVNPLMDTKTAGFIGIAIFLVGMGLVIILQASMMSDKDTSFLKTFFLDAEQTSSKGFDASRASVQFVGMVSIPERFIKVPKEAKVYVCSEGLYLEGLSANIIPVLYDTISSAQRDGNTLAIGYSQKLVDGSVKDFNMTLEADNALRLKAIENEISKHMS